MEHRRGTPTPADLGFEQTDADGWRRDVRGLPVLFRRLTTLAELRPLEDMQRELFGASELDVFGAGGLVVVPETGGAVLAALVEGDLAGALWGFGGLVDGRPRIVSDWMGVHERFRSMGLAAELKRLQAALALAAGFVEVVWTVDPLRAANARLNVAKLGATGRHYEVDRYGAYGAGLYGDMPTDRLHMRWDLLDPAVQSRLRGNAPATLDADPIPASVSVRLGHARALVPIPADIDGLLRDDPGAALGWRLRVRSQLQDALAAGYVVDGFQPAAEAEHPAYVLTRREPR